MVFKHKIDRILAKEYHREKRWKAFVYWWLAANGYDYEVRQDNVNFVDGPSDGGIDAIAWPLQNRGRKHVLVIQSKYFGQSPTEQDIRRFKEAVISVKGSLPEFQQWLEGCREELHPFYRRLRDGRRENRYVFITPCRMRPNWKYVLESAGIEVFDLDVLEALERNYTEGKTPRLEEVHLATVTNPKRIAHSIGIGVWVFTVAARQLGLAFERHGNALFAGNIRYALRGDTARRVRTGMLDTLEKHPHEFIFSHNGITVTGDGLKRRRKKVVLKNATIVNGAQTVSYLGSPAVMRRLSGNSAHVFVKFVAVDNASALNEIESKVAFKSNNQNKVAPSDLMIGLPSLVSLQRFFRRHGFHLERKKGEQKLRFGEPGIGKERLAQVLSAIDSGHGAVQAKRKQELFEEQASDLFGHYDVSDNSRMEAIAWARVDDEFRLAISRFRNRKTRKRAQIAELASLAAFHGVLRATGLKHGFLRAMSRWSTESVRLSTFLDKSCKAVVSCLLQRSAHDKKNEPAFYKAVSSVQPAVKSTIWRCRRKVRHYYAGCLLG